MTGDDAPTTLRTTGAQFLSLLNPRIIALWLACALAVRLVLGRWTLWDAALAAALIVAQPFAEWSVHRYLLHLRPRRVAGRWVELPMAREHRRHHEDPHVLHLLPTRSLIATVILVTLVAAVALPAPLAATAVTVLALELLVYVWVHFLIHAAHRPRTRLFAGLRRGHMLHHGRSDRAWFGVTSTVADHLLGTRAAPTPRPDRAGRP